MRQDLNASEPEEGEEMHPGTIREFQRQDPQNTKLVFVHVGHCHSEGRG